MLGLLDAKDEDSAVRRALCLTFFVRCVATILDRGRAVSPREAGPDDKVLKGGVSTCPTNAQRHLQPIPSLAAKNRHEPGQRRLLRLVFFAFHQFVAVENVLLGDYAFESAEIGSVDNRQDGRRMHVSQGDLQREVGMKNGEALCRQVGTKR